MNTGHDLRAHAQALVDTNAYMTLGTVGDEGTPWTTPVYFAEDNLRDFYWVSSVQSLHSRNVASHPEVSLVVFDSTVAAYHGRALYASANARMVADEDLDRALEIYPGPVERGGSSLTREDVTGEAAWRVYCATASDVWVLCPRDPRQPCPLHDRNEDHRVRVV